MFLPPAAHAMRGCLPRILLFLAISMPGSGHPALDAQIGPFAPSSSCEIPAKPPLVHDPQQIPVSTSIEALMKAARIQTGEARMDELVKKTYVDPANPNLKPILDGAIDATLYARAPLKILWIMKEPWEDRDANGGAGGWSQREDINKRPEAYFGIKTHRYVYYVSFGLLKAARDWAVIRNSQEADDFKTLFRSIAHINVKKLPNKKSASANNDDVVCGYEMGKDIIHRQIELYKPDVVIGCNPHMPAIIHDLSGGTARLARTGHATHCRIGGTIFISGYHPAQRTISKEKYVLDLLKAYDAEKQTL